MIPNFQHTNKVCSNLSGNSSRQTEWLIIILVHASTRRGLYLIMCMYNVHVCVCSMRGGRGAYMYIQLKVRGPGFDAWSTTAPSCTVH